MKKLCPLTLFYNSDRPGAIVKCLGKECTLAADNAGNCLIKQFLELQVSKSLKEKEAAETYWATKKMEQDSLLFSLPQKIFWLIVAFQTTELQNLSPLVMIITIVAFMRSKFRRKRK